MILYQGVFKTGYETLSCWLNMFLLHLWYRYRLMRCPVETSTDGSSLYWGAAHAIVTSDTECHRI